MRGVGGACSQPPVGSVLSPTHPRGVGGLAAEGVCVCWSAGLLLGTGWGPPAGVPGPLPLVCTGSLRGGLGQSPSTVWGTLPPCSRRALRGVGGGGETRVRTEAEPGQPTRDSTGREKRRRRSWLACLWRVPPAGKGRCQRPPRRGHPSFALDAPGAWTSKWPLPGAGGWLCSPEDVWGVCRPVPEPGGPVCSGLRVPRRGPRQGGTGPRC